MKNIYEDANSRQDMQDIGSGGAENLNNATPPARASQPPVSQPNIGGQQPQVPQLQLTQEQVAALLSQLLGAQQTTQVQPQQPQQEQKKETASPLDSGKRILYQSPDFDDTGDGGKTAELPASKFDEQMKRSFYDDDDIFDSEEASKEGLRSVSNPNGNSSKVRTTILGKSFSVDEIEYVEDDSTAVKETGKALRKSSDSSAAQQVTSDEEEIFFETEEEDHISIDTKPKKASDDSPKKENKNTVATEKRAFVPSIEIEEITLGEPEEKAKEKKKISTTEIVRRIVLAVSFLAMIIAAAILVREYTLHKQNQDLEDDVKNLIVDVVETTKVKKKDKKENEKTTTADAEATTALTPEQQWAEVRAEFPNVIFPPNSQLKYAKLYATNQDFVGYLSADGVNLNLPIVQAQDDQKYLTKNFYGKDTKYGCPFVTHVNNIRELDTNTVIFGHHMNDGTVFGALDAYKTIDGFKKAPVITFNTLYNDYKWKVIAAFITNAYEEEDNGYVFKYYFASLSTQERFSAYLNELSQRSLYDTGVDVLPTDKLLTLSTCSHEFNEARMVVVARLVRPGESTKVDVDKATVNNNPRYPQAYYTKKKLTNPYADAARWEVG
ncbi:MAG: class B sortase [Faecalibacterium sp.]|nr:class B sortase [Ruminococcus sp.]MCM1392567.1 class B sortase [Ruminococcus sp.]MCM1485642.1 class B sortase [Faecalibacterium sp.]